MSLQERLQLAEQHFREQQRLVALHNQLQQQHHTEELNSLHIPRDTKARQAKSLVAELFAIDARLQVSHPHARDDRACTRGHACR